jgi:hypothetical protein
MEQHQQKKKTSSHKISDEAKEKFEQLSAQKVEQPTTRKVKLVMVATQGCGCGGEGSEIDIEREVPYNSPLKEGDKVYGITVHDTIL